MTITLILEPEVQAELTRRAAACGSVVETYAASLLQAAVQAPERSGRLNEVQLDHTLREMAKFSHKIPILPDSTLTRESIYQDHD
jgi:hypothetical protein